MDIEELNHNKGRMTFKYYDGTRIVVVTTLSETLLYKEGLPSVDGFIDILSRRVVPLYLFKEVSQITIDNHIDCPYFDLTPIEIVLQEGVKMVWEKLE